MHKDKVKLIPNLNKLYKLITIEDTFVFNEAYLI